MCDCHFQIGFEIKCQMDCSYPIPSWNLDQWRNFGDANWQRISFMCRMKLCAIGCKLFLAKNAEAAKNTFVECVFCPLSVFGWHTYPPRSPSCLTSTLETRVDISLLNRASRGGQIPGMGQLPASKPAAHTLSGGHRSRAVRTIDDTRLAVLFSLKCL